MKPVVNMRRCFASKDVCMAIKVCPFGAISYAEVDEPITDKTLKCNCNEREALGLTPMSEKPGGGCDCGGGCEGENNDPLYDCGGTPYGRIIIDYDKCKRCGICVKECCGTAIGMYPEHYDVDAEPVKSAQDEKCSEMPEESKMLEMFLTMCKSMSKEDMMKMCASMMSSNSSDDEAESSDCGCAGGKC